MRGTWKKGSFTEHSEISLVKKGFEKGASHSLYRDSELKTSRDIHGRLWQQNISCIGLDKGNLRHLARGDSASMFIGLEPICDKFFFHA